MQVACLDEEVLAAFAEGQIDDCERASIEQHLADCDECRALLARAVDVTPSHSDSDTWSDAPSGDVEWEEFPKGTRVGRYHVDQLVGRGAMGAVYAASDPDLDRRVAVKVLRAEAVFGAARERMRARLLREAKAMARLSHPEVIAVYDVGTVHQQLFVAMEYVEGETLRRWRSARHRSYAEILSVYERAGSGLAAAHEAGLVHRDFKPDNVLVGRDGRVRVTDFGLACSVDQRSSPVQLPIDPVDTLEVHALTLTRTGTLLGTPAYMSPEQLRGQPADARSDVFSFCVALYEALYGERPFPGSTVPALLAAIEARGVRSAPVMTHVPGWLRKVLLQGLRAAPDERFPSMRSLLDELRKAQVASRRRLTRALGVATGALAVVGAIAIYTRSAPGVAHHDESTEPRPLAPKESAPPPPSMAPDTHAATAAPTPEAPAAPSAAHELGHRLPFVRPTLATAPHRPFPTASKPRPEPAVGNNGAFILE